MTLVQGESGFALDEAAGEVFRAVVGLAVDGVHQVGGQLCGR